LETIKILCTLVLENLGGCGTEISPKQNILSIMLCYHSITINIPHAMFLYMINK